MAFTRMRRGVQGWDGWYLALPMGFRVWLRIEPTYGEERYGHALPHDGRSFTVGWRRF